MLFRPDIIDSAILRPGRLDQLIYIPLPDEPVSWLQVPNWCKVLECLHFEYLLPVWFDWHANIRNTLFASLLLMYHVQQICFKHYFLLHCREPEFRAKYLILSASVSVHVSICVFSLFFIHILFPHSDIWALLLEHGHIFSNPWTTRDFWVSRIKRKPWDSC